MSHNWLHTPDCKVKCNESCSGYVHAQAARVRSQQINSTGTKIFEVLPLSGVIAPYSRATLTAVFKPVTAGRVKGFKATAPPSDEAFTYACQLSFDGYVYWLHASGSICMPLEFLQVVMYNK